jgi:RNA polymerase sigma-70 factor (ECF subfamily)
MAIASTHPVLRFLRALAVPGQADAPDAQLLQRFVSERDQHAFTALLKRHGPMVLGVCARVLGDSGDAEDAFQATFLVLVRRAGSLGRPELLGNWLYGVAYRTAQKARLSAARRRQHEDRAGTLIGPSAVGDVERRELRRLLDAEMTRLPERYRVPLVLCDLEGHTHGEAARRLGCPRATLTTRLTRAREQLRSRLVRRGLAVGTLCLAQASAQAVPPRLASEVTEAVLAYVADSTIRSIKIATLTDGVLKAMYVSKLKMVASVVAGVAIAIYGLSMLAQRSSRAEPPSKAPAQAAAGTQQDEAPPEAPPEADDEKVTVKSLPPVVVKTVPESGDTQVDAASVKEIRVTFSKEMMDQSWSWSSVSNDTQVKGTGKPSYDKDKRTCVLPVKLEAGRTYAIWVNSARFANFKDSDGRSSVPYLLVFETKP